MTYALFSKHIPAKNKYEVTNIDKIRKFKSKPAAKRKSFHAKTSCLR